MSRSPESTSSRGLYKLVFGFANIASLPVGERGLANFVSLGCPASLSRSALVPEKNYEFHSMKDFIGLNEYFELLS